MHFMVNQNGEHSNYKNKLLNEVRGINGNIVRTKLRFWYFVITKEPFMFLNIMFQNIDGKISVEIKIIITSRLHLRPIP